MTENKTGFCDLNWTFATLGTLHSNGKYYFEVLMCPKSVVQEKILLWKSSEFTSQSYAIFWS